VFSVQYYSQHHRRASVLATKLWWATMTVSVSVLVFSRLHSVYGGSAVMGEDEARVGRKEEVGGIR
jgi:hypothetical protein